MLQTIFRSVFLLVGVLILLFISFIIYIKGCQHQILEDSTRIMDGLNPGMTKQEVNTFLDLSEFIDKLFVWNELLFTNHKIIIIIPAANSMIFL